MQIGPLPTGAQALAGALDGSLRQHSGAARPESARAVSPISKGEGGRESLLQTKRDASDDDRSKAKQRGSVIDLLA
jgi:hypothetical protein